MLVPCALVSVLFISVGDLTKDESEKKFKVLKPGEAKQYLACRLEYTTKIWLGGFDAMK